MTASLPPQSIATRNAGLRDSHAIAVVFDAAVRANWTYLGPIVSEPLFTDDDWNRLVADHAAPNVLLVAEPQDGRDVLGFVAARPDVGELFLLFVHPDHAGRGVGRRLLGAAHNALRAAGCHDAFLYVHRDNTRAIAVYRRAGYSHDGTHRDSDFRRMAIRELRLVKSLEEERSSP